MNVDLQSKGWARIAADSGLHVKALTDWVTSARGSALAAVQARENAHWHDCEGTWFVGVDALPNDACGAVGDGPELPEVLRVFLADQSGGACDLHRAQVSVVWQGYPRPRRGESEGAFRYRQVRDAAHVDGLRALGADKRRHLLEPHSVILGIPLGDWPEDVAPLSVWEGSHEVMRAAFNARLRDVNPEDWASVDLTETYQAARREVFETCPKIRLTATVGEAIAVHRLALHGIGEWGADTQGPNEGRMVAYFRPLISGSPELWLRRN